jgi:hypothetical protein
MIGLVAIFSFYKTLHWNSNVIARPILFALVLDHDHDVRPNNFGIFFQVETGLMDY